MIISYTALLAFITTIAFSRADPEFCPRSDSNSCNLTSSSWACDNSSSSFSCSNNLSSDICDSSSSSSGYCDPCCAGVRKLTYQAPFDAGAYLAKVSQKFSVFDVFGPEACFSVHRIAKTLGVYVTLVGSDGIDVCAKQAIDTAADVRRFALDVTIDYRNLEEAANLENQKSAAGILLETAKIFLISALAAQLANSAIQVAPLTDTLVALAKLIIEQTEAFIVTLNGTTGINPVEIPLTLTNAVGSALVKAEALLLEQAIATNLPFGTYYTVSRAWALNKPIYALLDGVVSAANSLFNCFGEYRVIYLAKSLSDLTFVGNNNGNVCFDRCNGKPQSCLALCGGLQRPGFLPKFKIGV